MSTEDDRNAKAVSALLRERASLAGRGLDKRVAEVDAELKTRGHEAPKTAAEEKPKSDVDPKRQAPQGRTAAPKQSTGD